MIGNRVQLKTGRKDFMQEYVLLNKDDQPWGYAHFHYERFDDAKTQYTQAHLKTRNNASKPTNRRWPRLQIRNRKSISTAGSSARNWPTVHS